MESWDQSVMAMAIIRMMKLQVGGGITVINVISDTVHLIRQTRQQSSGMFLVHRGDYVGRH